MSSAVSASALSQAFKDLSVAWQQTRSYWRDTKSLEFEKKYLEELPAQIAHVRTVMEELDVLLRKVRHECE